jgi:hypothetical protein
MLSFEKLLSMKYFFICFTKVTNSETLPTKIKDLLQHECQEKVTMRCHKDLHPFHSPTY